MIITPGSPMQRAFYVHGSNRSLTDGAMSHPSIKDEAKANSFMKDPRWQGVIKFDEIKTFIGK